MHRLRKTRAQHAHRSSVDPPSPPLSFPLPLPFKTEKGSPGGVFGGFPAVAESPVAVSGLGAGSGSVFFFGSDAVGLACFSVCFSASSAGCAGGGSALFSGSRAAGWVCLSASRVGSVLLSGSGAAGVVCFSASGAVGSWLGAVWSVCFAWLGASGAVGGVAASDILLGLGVGVSLPTDEGTVGGVKGSHGLVPFPFWPGPFHGIPVHPFHLPFKPLRPFNIFPLAQPLGSQSAHLPLPLHWGSMLSSAQRT